MTETQTTRTTTERDDAADQAERESLSTADIAGRPSPDESHVVTTRAEGASPADGTQTGDAPKAHRSEIPGPDVAPLFSEEAAGDLRERWTDVQAGFVDEPRASVEQADALVAEVMKRLADGFATERESLEQHWSSGQGDASTEDLRIALRRYRSFFDRLLSV